MNPLVVAKPTSVLPAAVTGFITGSSLDISLEQQFLESQRAHISPLENKFANTYNFLFFLSDVTSCSLIS